MKFAVLIAAAITIAAPAMAQSPRLYAPAAHLGNLNNNLYARIVGRTRTAHTDPYYR